MKAMLTAMTMLVAFGEAASGGELTWLNELEEHLGERENGVMPVGDVLPSGYTLCALGSYASAPPPGYEKAEEDLVNSGLLPVAEGDGLLFSLNEDGRLQDYSSVSVWLSDITMVASEPKCVRAGDAQVNVQRVGAGYRVELSAL